MKNLIPLNLSAFASKTFNTNDILGGQGFATGAGSTTCYEDFEILITCSFSSDYNYGDGSVSWVQTDTHDEDKCNPNRA